jgi:hypothetical protein
MRGSPFVNRATVLVLHLGRLEHPFAFGLLACRCVIAGLPVNFRLVVVRVEVAWIRPIAYIHDRGEQCMAYFSTDRHKKSQDYDLCDKAKSHAARLSRAFRRVKGKLHWGRYPITDWQFLPNSIDPT